MSLTEREQEILSRYAHWQQVLGEHGLKAPETVGKFLEVAGCNGDGGCVADSCSADGGNGGGCVADSCSSGGGDGGDSGGERHKRTVQALIQERKLHLGKTA